MKYQVSKAAWFLYENGVSFYEQGTLDRNGVALFDFYRVDKVSAEQKAVILKWCKYARFFGARKEFAPELTSCMIAFPKAGFYRVGFSD